MYEVWVQYGNNEWKMIEASESYAKAEDALLNAYTHRAEDFISVAMYDKFDNRHMYADKYGKIEQECRVKWHGQERDNTFKNMGESK